MLKISVLSIIFFFLISCSGIKYEIREENKESALLAEYLEEVIINDWNLRTYEKIFLYDSLFALNPLLSDLVKSNATSFTSSISSALMNLSKKTIKSTPINFQHLRTIKKFNIYQSNLYINKKTGKFDDKYIETLDGYMPIRTKNAIVYLSQQAFSDDSKYLCFVVSNIENPNDKTNTGYGSIAFVLTKDNNKWKVINKIPLYEESGATP